MSYGRALTSSVYSVGALDWNRRLFDELIPLPDGTTYNAYFIQGSEKTVLIDSVDPKCYSQLKSNLDSLSITQIDYIISQHAEQDHSGSIPFLLEAYPMATIITNAKCKDLLQSFHHIPDSSFQIVQHNEILSLGDKHLQFFMTPWVHWPDTMCSYLQEDRILFSCDFFGSHLSGSQLFASDSCHLIEAGKRYFAEIMMPFSSVIVNHLSFLKEINIDMIAPSHGPVQKGETNLRDPYWEWCTGPVKNKVVLPYVSMHDSTRVMVDHLSKSLVHQGITVEVFDLVIADIGELASSLVDAATVVLATPYVLAGAHPLAAYGAFLINALRPRIKWFGLVGSFGWGGKMVDQITSLLSNMKTVEILEPVLVKGLPDKSHLAELDKLATTIAQKHTILK